ncbi:MAG: TonB-dependent receptor [Desulfobacterales bacterium]|nr:TonB-dependent receptor [Desulfobacterales bacterium]
MTDSDTVNAVHNKTDGLDVPYSEMTSNPAILDNYGVAGKTTKDMLERDGNYFDFSGDTEHFSVNAVVAEGNIEKIGSIPAFSKGTLDKYDNVHLSLGYKNKIADWFSFDARYTYIHNQVKVEHDAFYENFYSTQWNWEKTHSAEINAFIDPSESLDISIGLFYRTVQDVRVEYDLPALGPTLTQRSHKLTDDDNIDLYAVFAQVDYDPLDNLKIVAGCRVEHEAKHKIRTTYNNSNPPPSDSPVQEWEGGEMEFGDETNFIPRFALLYSLSHNHVLKFLYGQAINRPTFVEKYDSVFVNQKLDPEEITTYELNYIGGLFSSKLLLNFSVFRNEMDNLILRSTGFNEQGEYVPTNVNAGEMVTNGLELTIETRPVKNLFIELSGTWQKTEDRRNGMEDIDVGYSPNFLGYAKAWYQFPRGISLAVTGNYVDEMEPVYDLSTTEQGRIGEKVDAYFSLGTNLRIEDIYKGLFLNFRVSNLLDEEIRYPTHTTNQKFTDRGTFGHGRTYLVSLGMEF